MVNIRTAKFGGRGIWERYFLASDHPDILAVRREAVLMDYPYTAEWPVRTHYRAGTGYVLPDGDYLFPDGVAAREFIKIKTVV